MKFVCGIILLWTLAYGWAEPLSVTRVEVSPSARYARLRIESSENPGKPGAVQFRILACRIENDVCNLPVIVERTGRVTNATVAGLMPQTIYDITVKEIYAGESASVSSGEWRSSIQTTVCDDACIQDQYKVAGRGVLSVHLLNLQSTSASIRIDLPQPCKYPLQYKGYITHDGPERDIFIVPKQLVHKKMERLRLNFSIYSTKCSMELKLLCFPEGELKESSLTSHLFEGMLNTKSKALPKPEDIKDDFVIQLSVWDGQLNALLKLKSHPCDKPIIQIITEAQQDNVTTISEPVEIKGRSHTFWDISYDTLYQFHVSRWCGSKVLLNRGKIFTGRKELPKVTRVTVDPGAFDAKVHIIHPVITAEYEIDICLIGSDLCRSEVHQRVDLSTEVLLGDLWPGREYKLSVVAQLKIGKYASDPETIVFTTNSCNTDCPQRRKSSMDQRLDRDKDSVTLTLSVTECDATNVEVLASLVDWAPDMPARRYVQNKGPSVKLTDLELFSTYVVQVVATCTTKVYMEQEFYTCTGGVSCEALDSVEKVSGYVSSESRITRIDARYLNSSVPQVFNVQWGSEKSPGQVFTMETAHTGIQISRKLLIRKPGVALETASAGRQIVCELRNLTQGNEYSVSVTASTKVPGNGHKEGKKHTTKFHASFARKPAPGVRGMKITGLLIKPWGRLVNVTVKAPELSCKSSGRYILYSGRVNGVLKYMSDYVNFSPRLKKYRFTGLQYWTRYTFTVITECNGTFIDEREFYTGQGPLEPVQYVSVQPSNFWVDVRIYLDPACPRTPKSFTVSACLRGTNVCTVKSLAVNGTLATVRLSHLFPSERYVLEVKPGLYCGDSFITEGRVHRRLFTTRECGKFCDGIKGEAKVTVYATGNATLKATMKLPVGPCDDVKYTFFYLRLDSIGDVAYESRVTYVGSDPAFTIAPLTHPNVYLIKGAIICGLQRKLFSERVETEFGQPPDIPAVALRFERQTFNVSIIENENLSHNRWYSIKLCSAVPVPKSVDQCRTQIEQCSGKQTDITIDKKFAKTVSSEGIIDIIPHTVHANGSVIHGDAVRVPLTELVKPKFQWRAVANKNMTLTVSRKAEHVSIMVHMHSRCPDASITPQYLVKGEVWDYRSKRLKTFETQATASPIEVQSVTLWTKYVIQGEMTCSGRSLIKANVTILPENADKVVFLGEVKANATSAVLTFLDRTGAANYIVWYRSVEEWALEKSDFPIENVGEKKTTTLTDLIPSTNYILRVSRFYANENGTHPGPESEYRFETSECDSSCKVFRGEPKVVSVRTKTGVHLIVSLSKQQCKTTYTLDCSGYDGTTRTYHKQFEQDRPTFVVKSVKPGQAYNVSVTYSCCGEKRTETNTIEI